MQFPLGLHLSVALLLGLGLSAPAAWGSAADSAPQDAKQAAQLAKKEAAEKKKQKQANSHKDVVLPAPKKKAADELKAVNLKALRLAVEDLTATFGTRYAHGRDYLKQLAKLDQRKKAVATVLDQQASDIDRQITSLVQSYRRVQQDALLSNPLIDFDRLLLVKRGREPNSACRRTGKAIVRCLGTGTTTRSRPLAASAGRQAHHALQARRRRVRRRHEPELRCRQAAVLDARAAPGRWQIWEIKADGTGLRQVTPGEEPDVDNYNACYLPDGRILFDSTRCFQGVPCVGGGNTVANLCLMDADGSHARQLCFDQDHDWYPSLLNDGRVLYTRWEYTDTPHYFTRLLFHMNPDGTNQAEYYNSNSNWPNSTFYAKAIPNHPTKVVAVISGHHGVPRMGELMIFDPAKGRYEAEGAVQRIPGYGVKVEPVIGDQIVGNSWPKFLHPYPLSDKYFLTAMKPDAAFAVGHLPGRRVRQPDAHQGTAGLRALRAGAPAQDAGVRRSSPTA